MNFPAVHHSPTAMRRQIATALIDLVVRPSAALLYRLLPEMHQPQGWQVIIPSPGVHNMVVIASTTDVARVFKTALLPAITFN